MKLLLVTGRVPFFCLSSSLPLLAVCISDAETGDALMHTLVKISFWVTQAYLYAHSDFKAQNLKAQLQCK